MPDVELLSPVGDWECLKAAVQNGADSVYFGVDKFNARFYAANFSLEDMKKAISYCKIRNVKTHLTLNTLLKNSEFDDAVSLAKSAYEAGIDAIIVQDLGLAKYLIKYFPDLPIHASTQMTAHNLQGVLELEKLGFKRVVLSRELSIEEIEHICRNSNIEIEVFIHGALCICYSGQCLFSSVVGGRSGNRGKCAGPCRLPYELLSEENKENKENKENEGNKTNLIDKGYLLSPKDLCGLAYLPRLIKAGVKCFKIEGRMKTPEYVATVTRIYRKYIDMVLSGKDFLIDENDINDLMQVFNRGGFSSGHLDSKPNKEFIFPEKPNNIGIYLGKVKKFNKNKGLITLTLEEGLGVGDFISVTREESKYFVSELMLNGENKKSVPAGSEVTIGRMKGKIAVGDKIYRMISKQLITTARNSYENVENKKIPLNCTVTIKKNTPIKMEIETANDHEWYRYINLEVTSNSIPVDALKTPISVERVIKQISKTKNTPYVFNNITVLLDDGLYVPSISTLNELRRNALDLLEKKILEKIQRVAPPIPTSQEDTITFVPEHKHPQISLMLRHLFTNYDYAQLNKEKINRIYLPLKLFADKKYTNILDTLCENYDIYIYMPTIIKTNYKNMIINSLDDIVLRYNIKGFVLSNLADFEFLAKYKNKYDFIGNYSLNVFNNHSIEMYKKLGLSTVTLSRELNLECIQEILRTSYVPTELIVYGNLPIMATNYCFLGKTNHCYPDCGAHCYEDKKYYLKDRLGYKFRIIPDSLQTVTLICNSKTLSITTEDIPISSVRIDIIDEDISQINNIIENVYERKKLEGEQYTNGNLYRDV